MTAGGGAAFAVALAAAAALLARRSPALPFALWGAPAVVFGLLGRNPLPSGAVELGLVCFAALAIALAVARDPAALPMRLLAAPPVLAGILLAILIGVRLTSFELRRFLAEGLLFLVGGVMIGSRRRDFGLWALALAATGSASALLVTVGLAFDDDRWAHANPFALYAEATPRALARDIAAALVAAAYVVLSTRDERVRLGALTALPVLLIGYAASPDRGPLLGLTAGLVVLLALTIRRAARNALLLGVVPLLAAAVPIARLVSDDGASRLLRILGVADGSAHEWSDAWHAFVRHPLGGTGNAAVPARDLFLEAAGELGIVGLLAVAGVVVWLAVTLVRARRGAEREPLALVAALAVAAVLDAAVAGGLATTPYLWLAAGLALGGLIQGAPVEMLAPMPPEDSVLAPPRAAPLALGLELDDLEPVVGGTIELRARAEDDAAVGWVEFQVSPAGRHEWEALARVGHPPFALELDTTRLADGLYDFRALAADRGGRVELSQPARARRVVNATREIVLLEPPPGSWLRGTVELAARSEAPVVFELSADGAVWAPLPGGVWDTASVPDGGYLLRAADADGRGESAPVGIAVDNTPPGMRVDAVDLSGPPAATRIAADAEDAGSGVVVVRFEGSYDGAVWDELASLSEPPYAIDLGTEALSGAYLVRCVARDRVGNEAAAEPVRVQPRRPEPETPAAALPLERMTVWDLERLAAEGPDELEREERQALLYSLRPYANVDGTIPTQFWDLVRKTFGDLVG